MHWSERCEEGDMYGGTPVCVYKMTNVMKIINNFFYWIGIGIGQYEFVCICVYKLIIKKCTDLLVVSMVLTLN